MTQPLVVVVVLNWNGAEWTLPCVASLREQTYLNLEIIVVDNGSRDDSIEQLRKCEDIELISLGENHGFTGGNNAGIARALECGADWVLILNNDTKLHPNCVSEMMTIAQIEQKANAKPIGAVTPKIFSCEPRDLLWWAGGDIRRGYLRFTIRGIGTCDDGRWDAQRESPFVTGCCLLLSRRALEIAGAFDERFFAYYEDAELSLRLQSAGFACLYAPRAVLWHKESASVRKNLIGAEDESPFLLHLGTRNRLWTVRKHGTRTEIFLTTTIIFCRALLRTPIFLLRGKRRSLRSLWRGVRQGMLKPL